MLLTEKKHDFSKSYPVGENFFYRCLNCGMTIPSQTQNSMGCTCGNLFIDTSYARISVDDLQKIQLLEKQVIPPEEAETLLVNLINRLIKEENQHKKLIALAKSKAPGYPFVKGILYEISKSSIVPTSEEKKIMDDLYFLYA